MIHCYNLRHRRSNLHRIYISANDAFVTPLLPTAMSTTTSPLLCTYLHVWTAGPPTNACICRISCQQGLLPLVRRGEPTYLCLLLAHLCVMPLLHSLALWMHLLPLPTHHPILSLLPQSFNELIHPLHPPLMMYSSNQIPPHQISIDILWHDRIDSEDHILTMVLQDIRTKDKAFFHQDAKADEMCTRFYAVSLHQSWQT